MLRRFGLPFVFLLLCSLASYAQDDSRVEIFGGYEYLHASTGVSGVNGFNLNGWNASLSGYFTRNLGVTADFAGRMARPACWG
jgi:hypothetical protein